MSEPRTVYLTPSINRLGDGSMKDTLRCKRSEANQAFTLVELLIVLAIIALLIQLLLPAVQAAREAARRTQCLEHTRQLALGVQMHQAAHGHYPTGGWAWNWLGNPDSGRGRHQPGGWAFNILDYVEQQALRDAGSGLQDEDRAKAIKERTATPIPIFVCPTRRPVLPWPQMVRPLSFLRTNDEFSLRIDLNGRSDYAINAGDQENGEVLNGIPSHFPEDGTEEDFNWDDPSIYTGVSFQRSQMKPKHIIDGMSKTYLLGEKYVEADRYENGENPGDNENLYVGFDHDNNRTTFYPPRRDAPEHQGGSEFGSAHPTSWNVAMCDGSARRVSFDVDPDVHRNFGSRGDGAIVNFE